MFRKINPTALPVASIEPVRPTTSLPALVKDDWPVRVHLTGLSRSGRKEILRFLKVDLALVPWKEMPYVVTTARTWERYYRKYPLNHTSRTIKVEDIKQGETAMEMGNQLVKAPDNLEDALALMLKTANVRTTPEQRQDHMMAVHNVLEGITQDHSVTVNLLRDTANKLRDRADEMDRMASEIEVNIKAAAQTAVNAMKYERKAYAELLEVATGLERTVASVSPK